MSDDIPSFGSFVVNENLDGDKVRVDDILNKPIVITGFKISSSKYRDKSSGYCSKVQFYYESDETKTHKIFFSGSNVLKDQLEEIKVKLEEKGFPLLFKAMVKKERNYYTLV